MDTTPHTAKAGNFRKATVTKANDSDEGEAVSFSLDSVTIAE